MKTAGKSHQVIIGLCIWHCLKILHHCMSQNEGNRFAKYLMKPCDDFTIWFCQERPRLRSAPPFPCGLTPLTVWVLPSTRKWRKLQIFAARHDYVVLQIWRCGSLSRDQATILAEIWLFQGDCFTVCGSDDSTWRRQLNGKKNWTRFSIQETNFCMIFIAVCPMMAFLYLYNFKVGHDLSIQFA